MEAATIPQKFDIILADFPWQYVVYNNETGNGRSAEKHYRTRDPKIFYKLPMLDLLNPNGLIFLWATKPNLMEVEPMVQAWNDQARYKYQRLKYKTGIMTWAKLNKRWKDIAKKTLKNGVTDAALEEMVVRIFANGNGFYTMANTELILTYGRGQLSGNLARLSKNVRDIQALPIQEHSEKPDKFNQLISTIFPKAQCLEMFARRYYGDPRWTCIGDQLSGRDIHEDIHALLTGELIPNLSQMDFVF